MAREIRYGNIELEIIGGECIFKCLKCTREPIFQDMRPVSIRKHLSHAHKECPPGRVICPYFPATFWRMGNLKRHFLNNSCPNVGDNKGVKQWNDIIKINNEFNAVDFI